MKKLNSNKNPSATKSGPGRYHENGLKKAKIPESKGEWTGIYQASAAKRERRTSVKAIGRRQTIKAIKLGRMLAKEASL